MPALPAVPKTVRLDFIHSSGSDLDVRSRNFWTYSGATPTPSQLAAFLADVATAWETTPKGVTFSGVTLTSLEATDLSSPTSAQSELSVDVAGTRGGAANPADAALVMGYTINRRYRGGHPRGYWPWGVEEDLVTVQTWSSDFLAETLTAMEDLADGIAGAGWAGAGSIAQVNVSYFEGFVAVENPITHRYRNVPTLRVDPVIDDILEYLPRSRVGSQRRRLGKA